MRFIANNCTHILKKSNFWPKASFQFWTYSHNHVHINLRVSLTVLNPDFTGVIRKSDNTWGHICQAGTCALYLEACHSQTCYNTRNASIPSGVLSFLTWICQQMPTDGRNVFIVNLKISNPAPHTLHIHNGLLSCIFSYPVFS